MINNYLTILQDDLQKKDEILDQMATLCGQQESLLNKDKLVLEEFDRLVDQKDILVQELNKLDDGFESVFNHVKEQLADSREMYKDQIKILQQLIVCITEKSISIQAKETRNKASLDKYFRDTRAGMHQKVKNTKAAYNYYKGSDMSKYQTSQFLDQKQ